MQQDDARAVVLAVRAALEDAANIAGRVGAMPPGLETVLIVAHLGALMDESGAMDMGEFLHAMAFHPPDPKEGTVTMDPYERSLMMEQETALRMGRETPMPDDDVPRVSKKDRAIADLFQELLDLLARRDRIDDRLTAVRSKLADLMRDG